MLSVQDALAQILAEAGPIGVEDIGLRAADGRTLAEPLHALRTQPPEAVSAMDGYAVRSEDAAAGATLSIIGTAPAGKPFSGVIGQGQTVRIFTGAVVPNGADAVIIQENVTAKDNSIILVETVAAGANIRPAGLDFHKGDLLLDSGTLLNARNIALAASGNHATLKVFKRPKIAVIATGDELALPGSALQAGQIVASNSFSIMALAERHGAEVLDLGIVDDDKSLIRGAISQALSNGADVIVTLGGASVGEHDLVQECLKAEGVDLGFWKIAMRPGKPLMFGTKARDIEDVSLPPVHVLGLPGNPVSSYVCAELFLVPLIASLQGRSHAPQILSAILANALSANGPREHYARAKIIGVAENGLPLVSTFADQDSSLLTPLSDADGLVVQAANDPGLPSESIVKFRHFS
jgi:molybdopterin molybdotransferase